LLFEFQKRGQLSLFGIKLDISIGLDSRFAGRLINFHDEISSLIFAVRNIPAA
jgi:hypothetical protein